MKFEIKSADELKGMDATELQAYYVAKTNSEKEELENRIKSLEDNKDSEKYNELSDEVKALKDNHIKSLQDAITQQGIVMEKIKTGEFSGEKMMDLESSILKSVTDNLEALKDLKGKRGEVNFDVKVAGDMTLAGNVTGDIPQNHRLDGVNGVAEREAVIFNMIPKLNTAGNTIEWVYETAQDGVIDGTAEGTAKDQIDSDFIVTNISLVKRAAHYKISTEWLDDAPLVAMFIRNKLIVRLYNDIDNQVLNGTNAANQVNGVYTQATAFAAGTFALAIDNANNVDSLVVAANQIRLANHNGPLTIVMHPSDLTTLKVTKLSATDKRYLGRLMEVASTQSLDGIPIITTTAQAVGTFTIGEFSKAMVAQKGNIKINVGLDGNDFTNNMNTILAEWRGNVVIETNDLTAFVKGTFATTNAALETI